MTSTWTSKDAAANIPATVQTVLVSTPAIDTSSAVSYIYLDALRLGVGTIQDQPDHSLRFSYFRSSNRFHWRGLTSLRHHCILLAESRGRCGVCICIMFFLYPILCHVVTVTITIVVDPARNGENRQYKLAAGSLDLALTLASVPTGSGSASSNMGSNSSIVMQHGFDFFERPSASSSGLNTTGAIPGTVKSPFNGRLWN